MLFSTQRTQRKKHAKGAEERLKPGEMSHRMDSERMREGEEVQRRTGKPKGSPVRAQQTKKDHWKAAFLLW
jgi:hypothetical protein